ncbi:MAG: 3-keto-5-aminohexanoate cleavage protein [Alkaliphilus sp.]
MQKLIITAALTGGEVTREHQPNLPLTPDEIAEAAFECYNAGVSIIHVHARDENGDPTQDYETNKVIAGKIAEKCNVIFEPSTGGSIWHSFEERMQPLKLNPEIATLDAGTCNFGDGVFMNSLEYIHNFAIEMKKRGIKPEFEIFERGMIENVMGLVKKGLVQEPLYFNFVLGVPGAMPGSIDDLTFLVNKIPDNSIWAVAGVGRNQLPLAVHSIAMGGHVRIGFEDNIYYHKGQLAESNAQLAERIVRIANEMGREVATPDETREILGILK